MLSYRIGFRAETVLALLVLVTACKKNSPLPLPSKARTELPPRKVDRNSALLFTYVEPNGVFATTDQADKVPEVARQLVRIMGQAKSAVQWRNNSNVDVIDLRELLADGQTQPRVMSREAFETGALAQLPPGDSCPRTGPHGPPLREDREPAASQGELPLVILYCTRWCNACETARQYLASNQIPFTFRDVENDASAARELQQKSSGFGILADRVPILDVRGRLLVGYDGTRLDGLLADW